MTAMFRQTPGKMAFVIVSLFSAMGVQRTGAVDILDDPIQIDERVNQLILTSNSLCWEMYRYHQQQPDFTDTYRTAKQLWTTATQIQEALRAGPVETEALQQQTVEMSQTYSQVAKSLAKWGAGDQTAVRQTSGTTQREVIAPGVGFEVPFVGIRVGGPDVIVTEEGSPQLRRLRLHPHARGSKRSLERELESVRVSLNYLAEDVGVAVENASATGPAINVKPTPPAPMPDAEVVKPRQETSRKDSKSSTKSE